MRTHLLIMTALSSLFAANASASKLDFYSTNLAYHAGGKITCTVQNAGEVPVERIEFIGTRQDSSLKSNELLVQLTISSAGRLLGSNSSSFIKLVPADLEEVVRNRPNVIEHLQQNDKMSLKQISVILYAMNQKAKVAKANGYVLPGFPFLGCRLEGQKTLPFESSESFSFVPTAEGKIKNPCYDMGFEYSNFTHFTYDKDAQTVTRFHESGTHTTDGTYKSFEEFVRFNRVCADQN